MPRITFPLALCLLLTACSGGSSVENEKRDGAVKIGVVVSLTGPAAEQGKNWLNGVTLASEELNAKGEPVTLVVEDDGTQVTQVASAFNKLVRIDGVDAIIGGTWDYLASVAYPLATALKTPFLTPTNSVELMNDATVESRFVFTNAFSMAAVESAMREYLKKHSIKRIAIVAADIPWGVVHRDVTKRVASELGIDIVYDETFPLAGYPDSLKISSLKATQAKPDLVVVTFDANGIELFSAELAKLGSDALLMDTQHIDAAYAISSDRERYERVLGIYPRIDAQQFNDSYRERFGVDPRVFAAHGYDSLGFLVHCLKRARPLTRESQCEYPGITGLHKISANTPQLTDSKMVVMKLNHGVLVPAE